MIGVNTGIKAMLITVNSTTSMYNPVFLGLSMFILEASCMYVLHLLITGLHPMMTALMSNSCIVFLYLLFLDIQCPAINAMTIGKSGITAKATATVISDSNQCEDFTEFKLC